MEIKNLGRKKGIREELIKIKQGMLSKEKWDVRALIGTWRVNIKKEEENKKKE